MAAQVLVVAFGGRVFGMDPASGAHIWRHEMDLVGQNNVVRLGVDGDRVYAMIYDQLECLDQTTGARIWRADVGTACETLLVAGDLIYAAGAGTLRAFRLDGTPAWSDDFRGQGQGAPALALAGRVIQADAD
jgi:outer membrane protein assembly factor BamB